MDFVIHAIFPTFVGFFLLFEENGISIKNHIKVFK